jgi:cephalosporin hydroxylase
LPEVDDRSIRRTAETANVSELLPPRVEIDLSAPARDYWLARVRQHELDFYAGAGISKFPEDLRVYEHLIWASRPDAVIELGSRDGGSALWFRDRLRTLASYGAVGEPLVVTVDIDAERARASLAAADPAYAETIKVLEGDVLDPDLPDQVAALLPPRASCLVVEDTAHVYDTTIAVLRGFARFVAPGGYMIIEDGCIDVEAMRADPDWPRGVLPAIADWLGTPDGSRFRARRDLERYGLSCHPSGFLQRIVP